jgi:hypothetical protein
MNKGWIKGKRIKIVVYLMSLRVNWTFWNEWASLKRE